MILPPVFSKNVFGFTQSMVSLLVSHMDLDTGISFLSGTVLLPNGAVTEVQLAGWETALCICNTVSEILNQNSCQYVTLRSQSQMLDGIFFGPTVPCRRRKLFRGGDPQGPVLGFSRCIWTELTTCSKITYSHGTLMSSFSPNHFQPSLVCSKMLAIFF